LTALNLKSVVRLVWVADNTDVGDLFLLNFGSPAQARSRAVSVATADTINDPNRTTATISGLPANVVVIQTKDIDTVGNIRAWAYGYPGTIEVELWFYSPATLDQHTLVSWLNREYALLATAS
jgi:hypothetical protein